jgi:nucleoid DNA-binding protein
MTKAEIIEMLMEKVEFPTKKMATEAFETVFEIISQSLVKKQDVSIPGFGIFSVARSSARTGINPKTMQKIKIAAKNRPKFKASKTLKDLLN